MRELRPEHIVDGRYRLVRVIGSGTFGTVWCAEHLALRSMVAIKVLDPAAVTSTEVRERFIREAWAAAALRSPHVVQILDCGSDGNTTYIVMELLEGESLEQRISRCKRLDASETDRIVRHVGRAIDRAHAAGIVHRDLKPGNIFIQSNDGDELIKVLDFGIAKTDRLQFRSAAVGVTPAGLVLGTPQYMSPEQVQGASDLDYRTDIWSLGMIAFECLLGRTAFERNSISEVLHAIVVDVRPIPSRFGAVPPGFDAWFARACAIRPADRYESGKVAADEFARCCEVSAPSASAHGRVEPEPATPVSESERTPGAKTLRGPASWQSAPAIAEDASSTLRRRRVLSVVGALVGLIALWIAGVMRSEPAGGATLGASSEVVAQAEHAPTNGPPTPAAATDDAPAPSPVVTSVAPETALPAAPEPPLVEGDADDEPAPAAPVGDGPHHATPARAASAARLDRSARTPAKRSPARVRDDCDPPWSFDEHGQPKAKANCL